MKTYPLLKDVYVSGDYCLILLFNNNEKRLYDFKPNLDHKYYSSLKEKHIFNTAKVIDGEITWITGQDFCPHTLYENSVPFTS